MTLPHKRPDPPSKNLMEEYNKQIAAAKAEGAREAVERLDQLGMLAEGLTVERVRSIFQEYDERESSLGRDAEGHLVLTLGPGAGSPSRKGEREPILNDSAQTDWGESRDPWASLRGLSPLEQREADGDR